MGGAARRSSLEKAPKKAILVIDDEPLVLLALAREIRRRSSFEVIPVSSGEAALQLAASLDHPPAGVIVDIQLREPRDGIEIAHMLRTRARMARSAIFLITGELQVNADAVERMNSLGSARCFAVKPHVVPQLQRFLQVAEIVDDLEVADPFELVAAIRDLAHSFGLSDRESLVLRHLAVGRKRRRIAELLATPVNTIKRRISRILRKTGFGSTHLLRDSLLLRTGSHQTPSG
jgi:DNA-binding NarL/FixJ family response regulator